MRKLLFTLILIAITTATVLPVESQTSGYDPAEDWRVPDGFKITVDSHGFDLPTSIAVVPEPGSHPDSPVYFVTELKGTIKVVTNDRSVYQFAEDFFYIEPPGELPSGKGEVGLAGICLDPSRGYIFVTFAYTDANGDLRNNIVRFNTKPTTFALRSAGYVAFTDIFVNDLSAPSHQIGPCQIDGTFLYVSIGDGHKPSFSQVNDSTLGKILKMTLDGEPAEENPYGNQSSITEPANYVWAKGFRNPFGLKIVDGRIFVADNGMYVDRFVEVNSSTNYLWDGSDYGIGTNAAAVLYPSKGMVQMDRMTLSEYPFPDEYRQSFFIVRSGNLPWTTEPKEPDQRFPRSPEIITIGYSLHSKTVFERPRQFLGYRGNQNQMLVGLAFGLDGLFFLPLYPSEDGVSYVYKVSSDPSRIGTPEMNALTIMGDNGCFACHSLDGTGSSKAPSLDREDLIDRTKKKLDSPMYQARLATIDELQTEPFVSYRDARQEVLNIDGMDQMRAWLKYRIMEPRFDDPKVSMPNLGLTEEEAESIADFLIAETVTPEKVTPGFIQRLVERGSKLFPRPRKRHILYSLLLGLAAGAIGASVLMYGLKRKK